MKEQKKTRDNASFTGTGFSSPLLMEEVNKALEVLKSGGLLLYPTDTIWGIGCDATNKEAVDKIFKLKKREEIKSMIVLVDLEQKLNRYLKEVPEIAWDLIENSDKPLTIIYPDATGLASNLIHEDGSIAIRVVKDEFCNKLINRFGKPIVSTSANISGEATPETFKDISASILHGVDYVVNLRQNESGIVKPSTIIKLAMNGEIKIIRN